MQSVGDPYRVSADEEQRLSIRYPHGEWVEHDLVRLDVRVITLDDETYEFTVCGVGPAHTLFYNTIRDTATGRERLSARIELGTKILADRLRAWAKDSVCCIDDRHDIPWTRVKKVEKTVKPHVRRWYVVTDIPRARLSS